MTEIITHRIRLILTIVLSVLVCGSGFAQLEARPENLNTEVRYYGTACFTIQRGKSVLLTDPFISNPSKSQVLFGKIKTDVDYVEKYINPATLGKTKLVVAGHAHYDHLMDLPYLSKYIPEETKIVTNRTAKHILAYYNLPQQTMAANDILGDAQNEGFWVYSDDETMRVMAFRSQHPPHFAGINLMSKRYTQDLIAEPLMVKDWQEGKTMSFMVDFLEEDTIAYRMYFSSSLAKAPFSLFPASMLDEHPIDDLFISAILVSDFNEAPKPLIDLAKPKRVFLMHWENFFRSKEDDVKAMKSKELEKLVSNLKKTYGNSIEFIKAEPLNYY